MRLLDDVSNESDGRRSPCQRGLGCIFRDSTTAYKQLNVAFDLAVYGLRLAVEQGINELQVELDSLEVVADLNVVSSIIGPLGLALILPLYSNEINSELLIKAHKGPQTS
ncbi:hypothetical protein GH714_035146 [Hevea brasiliensis]|uniref:Uncharacterized protein n=1 Tax=Hevea brasiliensis TaxID=3981 RepID=A0A6A6NEE0_HEVBR|nr:hypothetical protein GH714_035146 [Hevea brasiliensis]